ncbi:hypothetical protein MMC07_003554 [Pseudocyphellaria aurata]|nr:hypothetical protein [Pseudocyphellaria aurata]
MASKLDESDKEDILSRGRALYRAKDYKAALQCFNTVVANQDGSLLIALDNRAATQIQLGDLESALRDGRRMIKEERGNSVGYLRTAKILQLLGKEEVALGIYRYGLGNVSPEESNFELLQSMRDKLASKIKAVDFVKLLPLELTEMVMCCLDFQTVVRLLRVSRPWNLTLSSLPTIWRHVDLSGAVRAVSMAAVRGYVQRSQKTIQRATLHLSKVHHDDILKYIISRCKLLQRLDIVSGCAGRTILRAAPVAIDLNTLILSDCDVTLDTMCKLLAACSNLERAEFHKVYPFDHTASWPGNMSKIRSLLINAAPRKAHERRYDTSALLKNIPNAQNLTLKNWIWIEPSEADWDFSVIPNLRILDLTNNHNIVFPRLPPSLRNLDLSSCTPSTLRDDSSITNIMESSLPEMRRLSLSNFHSMGPTELGFLLREVTGKLELLNLKYCNFQADEIESLVLLGFLKNVTQLSLAFLPVNDACVEHLANNLHHLKVLDLEATRVTGVGVKALVLSPCFKLERLNLLQCSSVSVDAVNLARSHRIHTTYGFPETLKHAKKVRS